MRFCFVAAALLGQAAARALVRAYDDALPQSYLEGVTKEALDYPEWEHEELAFDKTPSYWYEPQRGRPRFYVEAAIGELLRYARAEAGLELAGAEWWVHSLTQRADVDFHYDKDEAQHSAQGSFSHPVLSTITYLDDVGAPTLILNQSCGTGANMPVVASEGFLSYPKRNRHVVFQGNLHHGCPGRLSRTTAGDVAGFDVTLQRTSGKQKVGVRTFDDGPKATAEPGTMVQAWNQAHPELRIEEGDLLLWVNGVEVSVETQRQWSKALKSHKTLNMAFRRASAQRPRLTLLVNWWSHKPAEPNTVLLTDARARRFGLPKRVAPVPERPAAAGVEAEPLLVSGRPEHLSILRPGEGFWFALPGAVFNASERASFYSIHWAEGSTAGGVSLLNPADERQAEVLREDSRPKLYVFHLPEQHKQVSAVFLPASQRLLARYLPCFATPKEAQTEMEKGYGLRDADLPALVLHSTTEERIAVERRWDLTQERLVAFVGHFEAEVGTKPEL